MVLPNVCYLTLIRREPRVGFFFLQQRATLVFSEGQVDMKETEEEDFKRFLTKDKDKEAHRELHF